MMKKNFVSLFGVPLFGAIALFGTPALAADMAAAPVVPPAVYNWTGFYLGGQGGGGLLSNTITNVTGGTNFPAGMVHNTEYGSGGLGGIYAGYNYQISNKFVVGIDGDYTWSGLRTSASSTSPTGFIVNDSDKAKWIATVTGRVGFAVNNWLLYVKGGWADAGFKGTETNIAAAFGNAVAAFGTNSTNRDGWIIGGGLEYGFFSHWSAKAEIDYLNLSASYNTTLINTGAGGGSPAGSVSVFIRNASSNIEIFKLGAGYRF